MKKGEKRVLNSIYPAKKEFVMYAVFRGPKDCYPDMILNRAKEAHDIVWEWKKEYWWAKEAFYRRVIIKMKKVTLYDVYKHERKII